MGAVEIIIHYAEMIMWRVTPAQWVYSLPYSNIVPRVWWICSIVSWLFPDSGHVRSPEWRAGWYDDFLCILECPVWWFIQTTGLLHFLMQVERSALAQEVYRLLGLFDGVHVGCSIFIPGRLWIPKTWRFLWLSRLGHWFLFFCFFCFFEDLAFPICVKKNKNNSAWSTQSVKEICSSK